MKRLVAILLPILLIAAPARAVKIVDITRLSGERSNLIVGMGLVVGLRGTGDGGDAAHAIRPLAEMLKKFANPTQASELANVSNVAIVTLTAVIKPEGAEKGDKLDVYVTSVGSASSLKGGRLFVSPMLAPTLAGEILALAQGSIELPDVTVPTTGVIANGAVMEETIKMPVEENGRIALVLLEPFASWTTASTMAKVINDSEGDGQNLAIAESSNRVLINIPPAERRDPASFISRIQRLPVPLLPTGAKVEINEKTGTIIITGDVEISPVAISHKGLTIQTINPPPQPTPRTPVITEKNTVALDTTQQGGAKLQELVDAMDMIKVPAEDRITIIKELYKTGKLHAKLIIAGQNQ